MNTPQSSGEPGPDIINLSPDQMVDHPAGAHYALWNGPNFLDVGVPSGGFVRFALSNLKPQWTLLEDAEHHQLPLAVRYDGHSVSVWWLPYDGPGARPEAQTERGMSETDYAQALQNLSTTRYHGLMDAAWGIGGWSTYRPS